MNVYQGTEAIIEALEPHGATGFSVHFSSTTGGMSLTSTGPPEQWLLEVKLKRLHLAFDDPQGRRIRVDIKDPSVEGCVAQALTAIDHFSVPWSR